MVLKALLMLGANKYYNVHSWLQVGFEVCNLVSRFVAVAQFSSDFFSDIDKG